MRWDYNVTPQTPLSSNPGSSPHSYGIIITKTLYDDSDVELATVETTVEDAKTNAGPDFVAEFFETSTQIFIEQVTNLFKYSAETGAAAAGPSRGTELGHYMTEALSKGLGLLND